MLGGLLTRVIPEYRLPIEVVLREINKLIQELGIEVELERIVNKDDIVELLMEFDEIIIASGMQKSHIPNKFKGYKNVIGALDILEDIKSKKIYRWGHLLYYRWWKCSNGCCKVPNKTG